MSNQPDRVNLSIERAIQKASELAHEYVTLEHLLYAIVDEDDVSETLRKIGANPGVDIPLVEAATASAERMTQELGGTVAQTMQNMNVMQENMAQLHGEAMDRMGGIMQALTAKKRIIRGPDGKAVGVEIVQ